MPIQTNNAVLTYLQEEQAKIQLNRQIDQRADERIKVKVGKDDEITYIRNGQNYQGNFPTASQVKARANDWLPTPRQINAVNKDEFTNFTRSTPKIYEKIIPLKDYSPAPFLAAVYVPVNGVRCHSFVLTIGSKDSTSWPAFKDKITFTINMEDNGITGNIKLAGSVNGLVSQVNVYYLEEKFFIFINEEPTGDFAHFEGNVFIRFEPGNDNDFENIDVLEDMQQTVPGDATRLLGDKVNNMNLYSEAFWEIQNRPILKYGYTEREHNIFGKTSANCDDVETAKQEMITQSENNLNNRLSDSEKQNLAGNKTLDGTSVLYHENNKPSPGDIGLGNVENKSSADIRAEITKSDISNTGFSAVDINLGNVENKSVTDIQNIMRKSIGTQLIENDWQIGSGSTNFFNINGNAPENYRVYGLNPKGERAILWECRPDSDSGPDGGWNTDPFPIDKTKTYRFSVFMKTTDNNGKSYFGCGKNKVYNLNTNIVNSNPYFWNGDLPENEKWFLLVGYIFPANETGLESMGALYDCENGKKVENATIFSFNWAPDAVDCYHRCYHFYNTNTSTRQWMYNPRVDMVDGNEPSIMQLMGQVAAGDIKYKDNTTLEELKPAQAGADITEENISADTHKVNNIDSATVVNNANEGLDAKNTLDTKSSDWDTKIGSIGKSANGELVVDGSAISGAMLTDTQKSDSDIKDLADGRIAAKVGSDTEIGYLRNGQKADGEYITALNVGAREDTWIPAASDIQYSDSKTLEELKPAQAGADITGQNKANDTDQVNGTPASTVVNNAKEGLDAKNTLDTKSSDWDAKIGSIGKSEDGELIVDEVIVEGAMLTDTQKSDLDIKDLADERIAAKVGTDTEIGRLRNGQKANGNYITAANVGAREDTWIPAASEIKYSTNESLEELKPSQAGADITGQNNANDTNYVNGIPASTVENNANDGKSALVRINNEVGEEVIETVRGAENKVNVVANDLSTLEVRVTQVENDVSDLQAAQSGGEEL